jgi:2-dehydro-3-deoxy-D-arabinonate dehydratase
MRVPLQRVCRLQIGGGRGSTEAWAAVADGRARPFAGAGWSGARLADLLRAADWGTLPAEAEVADEGFDWAELDAGTCRGARLLAPLDTQEVWAAGVTYLRSREARKEESKQGGDFYQLVYEADRPELFFKASPARCAAPGGEIVVRRDSEWNVPEPELALVLTPAGKLFGYTVGNDVSSRSIEGANPLYLPQAKVYAGACALGPLITLAAALPDARSVPIRLTIRRAGAVAYQGETGTGRMKRTFEDLIAYLFREDAFPDGVLLLTGTGIVPESPFTLLAGDVVEIEIPGIGTLRNRVRAGRE